MKAYLEAKEIALMEKAAACFRDRLLIRLLLRLGCRISEALALAVEDIGFAGGTVNIKHLKSHLRLSCPRCEARLGRSHAFCPRCGDKVEETLVQEQARQAPSVAQGGVAQTPTVLKNLALTKPWLEAKRRLGTK
jgi:integrase/recombinase XerD